MAISSGIFLIVIGAILTFAVTAETEGINLAMAGWILMIAGAATAVFGLIAGTTTDRTPDERERHRAH